MLNLLRSLFSKDPNAKLIKKRDRMYKEALSHQRNGNLREYARVIKEITEIEESFVETNEHIEETKEHTHDVADYDGMGNQGRFPVSKSKGKK